MRFMYVSLGLAVLLLGGPASAQTSPQKFFEQLVLNEWTEILREPDLAKREQGFNAIVEAAVADTEREAMLSRLSLDKSSEVAWSALLALREVELRRSMQSLESVVLATTLGRSKSTILSVRVDCSETPSGAPNTAAQSLANAQVHLRGLLQACEDSVAVNSESQLLSVLPLHWTLDAVGPVRGVTFDLDRLRVDLQNEAGALPGLVGASLVQELGALALPGVPQFTTLLASVDSPNAARPRQVAVVELGNDLCMLVQRQQVDLRQLGVFVVKAGPSAATIKRLGLTDARGVAIEKSVPNSLAHHMHVAPGSVLMELNGRVLKSGADITSALKGRLAHEPISLTWYDPTGTLMRHCWKPQTTSGRR